MEYQILKVAKFDLMEDAVNRLIDEGWKPCGGVSIGDNYLVQALTREK